MGKSLSTDLRLRELTAIVKQIIHGCAVERFGVAPSTVICWHDLPSRGAGCAQAAVRRDPVD
jgi:hypothetical protein